MKEATLNVDLDAIVYNYRHLKCFYKKNIIAVLKDDAYGVGIIEVMKALQYEENIIIGVNHLNEAIKLRENGYEKGILYMNVFDENDLNTIQSLNLQVIVESLSQLSLLKNTTIPFHLKFNTGMNRLGLNEEDSKKVEQIIHKFKKQYNLIGLMTHFATNDKNHECYKKFVKMIENFNKGNLIVHCFASSSLDHDLDDITNTLRIGIKLYGIGERNSFLHPALTLTSPILKIRAIKQQEFVGYDYLFKTPYNGYLYILPIGYGQGWGRFITSLAYTNFCFLKQAGNISMDYSTYFSKEPIDITQDVELFGKNIQIEELARINHIDPHEILVRLKVKKIYNKKTL